MKEGIDWNEKEHEREEEQPFESFYSEQHIRAERINSPPRDNMIYAESSQRAQIQSNGESGRLITVSQKEFIRCDCGCIVDDIKKTRRDKSGQIFCERHASIVCRLCSNMIHPDRIVKINDSLYHRRCAEKVIDRILDESAKRPEVLSPIVLGELKSMKDDLYAKRIKEYFQKGAGIIKRLISKRKSDETQLRK